MEFTYNGKNALFHVLPEYVVEQMIRLDKLVQKNDIALHAYIDESGFMAFPHSEDIDYFQIGLPAEKQYKEKENILLAAGMVLRTPKGYMKLCRDIEGVIDYISARRYEILVGENILSIPRSIDNVVTDENLREEPPQR